MKSKAAIFVGAQHPLELVELDLDEPGPTDVLVRMAAVGICGTDLHQVKGEWRRPTPMVLGHEGAGIIERVGRDVSSVKVGQPVVLTWSASCGTCRDCRRGRPAACLQLHRAIANGTRVDGTTGMSLDGSTVYRGTATGALTEYLVVDAGVVVPLPDGMPMEQAALLGCAALTGVGAVLFVARPKPGAVMLVVGAGGVGQFCVQAARIAQAARVVCVDPIMARRARSLQLGATHAVDPDELQDLMDDIAPDGADYAFDVVGDAGTVAIALRFTRSGGTTVIVGLPPTGVRLDIDPAEFNRREKWLTGTMYGSEDPKVAMPILLEHVRTGRLDLAAMVGPSFPLARVNEAVSATLAGSAGRVLVTP